MKIRTFQKTQSADLRAFTVTETIQLEPINKPRFPRINYQSIHIQRKSAKTS